MQRKKIGTPDSTPGDIKALKSNKAGQEAVAKARELAASLRDEATKAEQAKKQEPKAKQRVWVPSCCGGHWEYR